MISYSEYTLPNGLKVIAHRDKTSKMAAMNIIYKVGSRNESPLRTGFAHLFEHLMFGGSVNIPDFDMPVQMACGENNAFTNNDYTNYYITLPTDNIETAFWLESDRMLGLAFNEKSLEVQRKVVIEEFNQRYLNRPYGDLWLLLRPLVYKVHPYRWATIGMTPDHIASATMEEVKTFYKRYYNPDNAILSVAADISPDKIFEMAAKWFGEIPSGGFYKEILPQEPLQTGSRRLEVVRDVPATVVTIVFHMGGRVSREYNICDVASDILSSGNSSRMYRELVQEKRLFSSVNAYVSGELDPGLFVVTGHLMPGVSVEQAEEALWEQLERISKDPVADYEFEKVKNKFEASVFFGEINVMNKAMNLGFYDMLGDVSLVNREVEQHNSVTKDEIMETSSRLFVPENSSTLIYMSSHENK